MRLIPMRVDLDNPPAVDQPVLATFFYGNSRTQQKRLPMGMVLMTIIQPPWKDWPKWLISTRFVEIENDQS